MTLASSTTHEKEKKKKKKKKEKKRKKRKKKKKDGRSLSMSQDRHISEDDLAAWLVANLSWKRGSMCLG